MSRGEMIKVVNDHMNLGMTRVDAIRNLAIYLGDEDPCSVKCDEHLVEYYFQQKIGGE